MNLQQISQLGRLAAMEKTGSLSPFAQRGQTDLMLLNQLSQSFAPVMTAPQQQMRSGFETLPGFSDPGIMGLIMNQFVAPRLTTIMGKQGLVPGGLSSQNILDYQDAQRFHKVAQLGRLAAMEKVGGKRNRGGSTSFSTSLPSASSFLPNRPPPTSPVLKKLKADPKTNLAMGDVQKYLHGAVPRGALRAPISEQGTVPLTYKATTPWPKRLYQQRHGTRKLTPAPRPAAPTTIGFSRDKKDRSAWAYAGTGIGNVPKRPSERRQNASDIDDVVNYWATKNHEGEHAFDQPVSPPRFLTNPEATEIRRDTFEVGPSIGDIIFRGEQFAREEGKDLEHTVKLPGGVEHDINWMRRQARKYNYWGSEGQDPRSMHDLIFNTTAGQQWYKRMVEGEASGLYP